MVIVTGAGQRLGRAYALELARPGASVVVNDVGGLDSPDCSSVRARRGPGLNIPWCFSDGRNGRPENTEMTCRTSGLVTVFAKNEKDNLTKAEQSELIAMSKALLACYGDRT